MAPRIITDSETDTAPTLVFAGDLLEIDSPGSLQTPEVTALNGAVFSMTTGATLTVTGVADPSGGLDALSLNGLASIDGAVVNASAGVVAIGNSGNAPPSATGALTVSNAATVTAAVTAIGSWNVGGPDVGSLFLIGAGTSWQDTGDPSVVAGYGAMEVGALGTGHLKIQSGATASERAYAVIGGGVGANGDATVDGAGSSWTIGTYLRIGAFGTGSLTVSNKATVSAGDYVALGYTMGGSGSVSIDTGATLDVGGTLWVGAGGTGTLSAQNGGTITAAELDISHFTGSSGTVTVDGATLTSSGRILVGESSPGTLTLKNTSTVSGTDISIGYASGTDTESTAEIDSSSTLKATGTLAVGISGIGTLSISGGSTVTANLLLVAAAVDGGIEGFPSALLVDGARSSLNVATYAFVDSANPLPDMPPDFINGQFGRWVYSNSGFGKIEVVNNGYLSIGNLLDLQEPGYADEPVSLWVRAGGSAEIGGNSGATPGTLTIDSGGELAGHGRAIVADGTIGDLTNLSLVNNGFLFAQHGTLTIDADITGTGTLQIDQDAACDIDGHFTGTVLFNGTYDTTLRLEFPSDSAFKGTLSNLQIGDVISLKDSAFAPNLSHTEINGSSLVLTLQDRTTWSYDLSGDYAGDVFTTRSRMVNGKLYDELTLQPANPKIETGTGVSGTPTNGANAYIDSLVWGWAKWKPAAGPITFWFGSQDDVKPAVLAHGETTHLGPDSKVDTWNNDEQAAFLSAFGAYESVSDVRFQTASSADTADVIWWLTPGLLDTHGRSALGISDPLAYVSGGSIWQYFNDTRWLSDPDQLNFGGDGQDTVTHEIGHLLGLADPGIGGDEPDAKAFPSGTTQDQAVFTALSLSPGWSGSPTTSLDYGTQGGLGALDIAAIQTMYGKNMSTGAGDTIYQLQTDNQVGTGWKAIWDPNGFNTISNKGSAKPAHIDLRAAPLTDPDAGGYPSYVLGVEGGFTIANGTEVDGAMGGTGDDDIHTNSGPDVIDGGAGNDTVEFSLPLSAYILSRSGNTTTVRLGSVTDTLVNIYQLNFADQNVLTSSIACFAEGTCIATARGEVAVEALQPGDQILTLTNETHSPQPAIWIGRRHIDLLRHPEPERAQPIRIRRDAIAPGQPARDLLVSPDHAIFIDGGLIPAKLLVNGGSIVQERGWTSVTYYHVELPRHAVILAEGLRVESYLDTGNRNAFGNGGGAITLHPDFGRVTREDNGCAPLVTTSALVQPVWDRLARRAAAIGDPPALPEATDQPALTLRVNGRRLRPVSGSADCCVFLLPSDAREVRLVSRAARPNETRPWVADVRRLGVRIGRITVSDNGKLIRVALDGPALREGWWSVETEGGRIARWTDGDARLWLPRSSGGVRMLMLNLAGSTTYPAEAICKPHTTAASAA